MSMFKKFSEFLVEHKQDICRDVEVLVEDYSPTYGASDPRQATMTVIDFDLLCAAIDQFSSEFE